MNTKELLELIYGNFTAFHTMCLSAALMSTYNSDEFDSDARKITDFIGKAFGLSLETSDEFGRCIIGEMMNIGLISDYHAIASEELLSEKDKENVEIYEIKGRVLEEVAVAEAQNCNISDMRIGNQIKANMKYDFFHHPYNARLRFWQLERLSKSGNVDVTRQVAILQTLGIGCEADYSKAEENYKKCILWGDKISALLISELHRKTGKADTEYYKLFSDNETLSATDSTVFEYWQLTKLISACIIAPKKDTLINTELARVLISDKIPFKNKTEMILNYSEKIWQKIYVTANESKSRIGFRVKRYE